MSCYDTTFPSAHIRAIQPYYIDPANLNNLEVEFTHLYSPRQTSIGTPTIHLPSLLEGYNFNIHTINTPITRYSSFEPGTDVQRSALRVHKSTPPKYKQPNTGKGENDGQPTEGFSTNYHGVKNERNKPDNITNSENCAVWVEGLPADIDYPTLLSQLRDTGKIYAIFINSPIQGHRTCAAKIEFWGRDGVAKLFEKVKTGNLKFDERVPTVRPNRVKKSAQPTSPRSRVIEIRGPVELVNYKTLTIELRQALYYDIESVETLWTYGGQSCMRWTFASHRNQAETAMRLLVSKKNHIEQTLWQQVVFR
ncbi:uncharacterized protein F4812DRAFT_453263 [Daldinia caldariorum]|uniref:uncharacterized protein n=1 Tax=Daldinia caldariorum TaxID=326644 RepID=UPI0020088AE8|nr:uncharacterized protein F4812DRAFT_453263 [Daldinia caldariorum]KAI1463922.1 hypothetical protein F4812DRAFT_453263 [Daldinia caldariorum]